MKSGESINILPLTGIGDVTSNAPLIDSLAKALDEEVSAARPTFGPGDVLVVAQKIVSKAEGRNVNLDDVQASSRAKALALETGKNSSVVELILSESQEVLRVAPNLIIVRDRRGLVLANAGIDQSNIRGENQVLLLPVDPDRSAAELREAMRERYGVSPGVIISDSLGRAWRLGTVNAAIGAAGLPALIDKTGETDLYGRDLKSTVVGFADAIAAAAGLAMGEAAEGVPAALVRSLTFYGAPTPASSIQRPREMDLFT